MSRNTTTTVFCDQCGKQIGLGDWDHYKELTIEKFDITRGTATYVFPFTDFCSSQCFVEKIIKFLNFQFKIKEDGE